MLQCHHLLLLLVLQLNADPQFRGPFSSSRLCSPCYFAFNPHLNFHEIKAGFWKVGVIVFSCHPQFMSPSSLPFFLINPGAHSVLSRAHGFPLSNGESHILPIQQLVSPSLFFSCRQLSQPIRKTNRSPQPNPILYPST